MSFAPARTTILEALMETRLPVTTNPFFRVTCVFAAIAEDPRTATISVPKHNAQRFWRLDVKVAPRSCSKGPHLTMTLTGAPGKGLYPLIPRQHPVQGIHTTHFPT